MRSGVSAERRQRCCQIGMLNAQVAGHAAVGAVQIRQADVMDVDIDVFIRQQSRKLPLGGFPFRQHLLPAEFGQADQHDQNRRNDHQDKICLLSILHQMFLKRPHQRPIGAAEPDSHYR